MEKLQLNYFSYFLNQKLQKGQGTGEAFSPRKSTLKDEI